MFTFLLDGTCNLFALFGRYFFFEDFFDNFISLWRNILIFRRTAIVFACSVSDLFGRDWCFCVGFWWSLTSRLWFVGLSRWVFFVIGWWSFDVFVAELYRTADPLLVFCACHQKFVSTTVLFCFRWFWCIVVIIVAAMSDMFARNGWLGRNWRYGRYWRHRRYWRYWRNWRHGRFWFFRLALKIDNSGAS